MVNSPQENILQVMRRILAGRQPEPVKDETKLINEVSLREQLNELFTTISTTYFTSLAQLQAEKKEFASSPENMAQAKENALSDFHDEFNKCVAKRLNVSSPLDIANVVLDSFLQHIQQHTPFHIFLSTLSDVFSQDESKIKGVNRTQYPELRKILAVIAAAIQDVVIAIPPRYFFGIEPVPETTIKALQSILIAIDRLQQQFVFSDPARDHSTALRDLYIQIARADNYIWLPFSSLVTAPLTKEDLAFYARNTQDAEQLARLIIKGDGVFLITGYRGVGKSSFIFESLSMLPALEEKEKQHNSQPWRTISICLSLAKASSITNVLRLCIRRLYETLLDQQSVYRELLTEEEKDHLELAYLRSAFTINVQRGDSVATLKRIGAQAGLGLKLGDDKIGGTFSVGADASANREWRTSADSTIALPDYDEDKAEEDIVRLIRMLSQTQTRGKDKVVSRIKLIFIFDEMDKMEPGKQGELINQLKNLFLERYTVFLLVTSKEFYYRWWEGRKEEDAVLSSYFSWIKMLPLFTSEETSSLLKRLIPIKEKDLSRDEKDFILTFARYLTYRARGIPRDIIRELQSIRQWVQEDLQTYLTDRFEQYPAVLVYAELQAALENVLDTTSTTATLPIITMSATQTSAADATMMPTVAPEHTWTNEARREQVKRGLYALVEELLDQESAEINPEAEIFKKIHTTNFNMVSFSDFKTQLDRLVNALQHVKLQIAAGSLLAQSYPSGEIKLFSLEFPQTTGGFQKFTVASSFYTLTGRPLNLTPTDTQPQKISLTLSEIEEILKKKERLLQRQRALIALKQMTSTQIDINENISEQLYDIFVAEQNVNLRLQAAELLPNTAFFNIERHADKQSLNQFIETETNEKLLHQFIRLIQRGADIDTANRPEGTHLLLQLLRRNHWFSNANLPPVTLSEAILIDTISALARIAEEDVLERVVESLDPQRDIPHNLLSPLEELEAKSPYSLIALFVTHHFTAIAEKTLQSLLRGRSYIQLMELWKIVIERKREPLAQQVLSLVLQQKTVYSTTEQGANKILEWLNGTTWDDFDQIIVRDAIEGSPDILNFLERAVSRDMINRVTPPSLGAAE